LPPKVEFPPCASVCMCLPLYVCLHASFLFSFRFRIRLDCRRSNGVLECPGGCFGRTT
jgi:hypothetical protein